MDTQNNKPKVSLAKGPVTETQPKTKYYRVWKSKLDGVYVLYDPEDRDYTNKHMPKDPEFSKWLGDWMEYT